MRIMALILTGVMAVSVADSAFAAKKKKPATGSSQSQSQRFEYCEDLSVKRDSGPGAQGQGDPTTESHLHKVFMAQCLAGKIN